MLITMSVNPSCFGSAGIQTIEDRVAAESVMNAMLQNAIVLTSFSNYSGSVNTAVAGLSVRFGQRLAILGTELFKHSRRIVRVVPSSPTVPARSGDTERVALAVPELDVIVCGSAAEMVAVKIAIGQSKVEVCLLADYPNSDSERRRLGWLQTQELHTGTSSVCEEIVGRAVCVDSPVIIADKMIGRATKDGIAKLRRFAEGVAFVARCANSQHRTFPGGPVEIQIVTVAGGTGAGSGYVDPDTADAAIRSAVVAADTRNDILKLSILFKSDRSPAIFRDRLLSCGGRCYGVRHGVDDLGQLLLPINKRSPTYLDPDCPANRRLLNEILGLQDVKN